jgi:DNA polymerase-4
VPADIPIQIDFFNDYEQHQRRLTLETTIDDIRRRFGTASINFASLTQGLKMPAHREIEFKMPSPMFQ